MALKSVEQAEQNLKVMRENLKHKKSMLEEFKKEKTKQSFTYALAVNTLRADVNYSKDTVGSLRLITQVENERKTLENRTDKVNQSEIEVDIAQLEFEKAEYELRQVKKLQSQPKGSLKNEQYYSKKVEEKFKLYDELIKEQNLKKAGLSKTKIDPPGAGRMGEYKSKVQQGIINSGYSEAGKNVHPQQADNKSDDLLQNAARKMGGTPAFPLTSSATSLPPPPIANSALYSSSSVQITTQPATSSNLTIKEGVTNAPSVQRPQLK